MTVDLGSETNAEWVERLNAQSILGAAKNLIEVAQNLTGPRPNGYAAASMLQQIGEFLTYHARPRSGGSEVVGDHAATR